MTSSKTTHVALSPDEGRCLIRLARMTIADRLKRPVDEEERRSLQAELQNPVFAHSCGTFVTLTKERPAAGVHRIAGFGCAPKGQCAPKCPPCGFPGSPLSASGVGGIRPDRNRGQRPHATVGAKLRQRRCVARTAASRNRRGYPSQGPRQRNLSAAGMETAPRRREDFLSHLCLKAGLTARAWRKRDLQVETYQVQYFEEGQ